MIRKKNRHFYTIIAVIAAVLLNGLFCKVNNLLSLPIFLDSIFTIMSAALFGLWPAVTVGFLTNFFLELINKFPGNYYPFAIVNILTAVITAVFVNKKAFETPSNAFWLIITLSIINALTGALIVTFLFGGFTNLSMDYIVRGLVVSGQSVLSSTFITGIIVNMTDKGIAVIITYAVYKIIQRKSLEIYH